MTSIAALAPALFSPDGPPAPAAGGEAFAPVLAALLTPAAPATADAKAIVVPSLEVCAIAPPVVMLDQIETPVVPETAPRQAAIDVPRSLPATITELVSRPEPLAPIGTPLPLVGMDQPVVASHLPDEPLATTLGRPRALPMDRQARREVHLLASAARIMVPPASLPGERAVVAGPVESVSTTSPVAADAPAKDASPPTIGAEASTPLPVPRPDTEPPVSDIATVAAEPLPPALATPLSLPTPAGEALSPVQAVASPAASTPRRTESPALVEGDLIARAEQPIEAPRVSVAAIAAPRPFAPASPASPPLPPLADVAPGATVAPNTAAVPAHPAPSHSHAALSRPAEPVPHEPAATALLQQPVLALPAVAPSPVPAGAVAGQPIVATADPGVTVAAPPTPVTRASVVPAIPARLAQPVLPPTSPVIRPAFQAFGAALHRAVAAERKSVATEPLLAPAPGFAPVAVAAPLDTTQQRWPEAMIARIEQVRDAQTAPGTAADTRIRLLPDALGPIDVALRREGEAVHVHLAAADPATAKLLADAQPRLTELAESKGLKLGQSTVDTGPGSNGGERRQPAAPLPATQNRPVAARAQTAIDTRLA